MGIAWMTISRPSSKWSTITSSMLPDLWGPRTKVRNGTFVVAQVCDHKRVSDGVHGLIGSDAVFARYSEEFHTDESYYTTGSSTLSQRSLVTTGAHLPDDASWWS